MIRLAIVDDHELVRDGLRTILGTETDLEIVAELADGKDVARVAAEQQLDVVLLDIAMPGVDGIQAASETAEASPDTAVIMLTTMPDADNVRAALKAGAHGYLLKTCSATELIQAVRDAHRGRRSFAPSVLDQLASGFVKSAEDAHPSASETVRNAAAGGKAGQDTETVGQNRRIKDSGVSDRGLSDRGSSDGGSSDRGPSNRGLPDRGLPDQGLLSSASRGPGDEPTAQIPPELASLTERELQVFREVGRGRSNAEIGATLFLSEKTVKTYVTRILGKVGLASRVQAVVLAFETGFVTRQN